MSAYDVIVIGAGHNGLTAAALLAKDGRRVVVLERGDRIGGLAAATEFHPGYRDTGLLHDTRGVRRHVVDELQLEQHGLRWRERPPDLLALGADGDGLWLPADPALAAAEIAPRSSRDAEAYPKYHEYLQSIRPVLRSFSDAAPLDLIDLESNPLRELLRRGFRLRRMGRREMLELLRLPSMSVADWLGEWFESDLLRAALALPAIAGTFLGPRSPGSNFNLLLAEATSGPGVVGGGAALVAALERACGASGVEIRTGSTVDGVLTADGATTGVRLAGGEQIRAPRVMASCDPKTLLLELMAPGTLPHRLVGRIQGFRMRGTTARLVLALNAPPVFAARPGQSVELARTGGRLNALERAFDAVKYRTVADEPVLEIHAPAVDSPDIAPQGHAVLSVHVHFVPYDLEPAWSDAVRDELRDRLIATLDRFAPGLAASVVGSELLGPRDIEARYGITGGHLHHGEQALDQLLVRPVPECAQYATPVTGLFLCGSGSHPGGGLTCAPGALAAAAAAAAKS